MNQVWWEAEEGFINTTQLLQLMVEPTLTYRSSSIGTIDAPYKIHAVDVRGQRINIPGEFETKEAAKEFLKKMIAGSA